MKTTKNCVRKITRLLFHFTEEDKQNNPVINILALQIPFGYSMTATHVMKNKLNIWLLMLGLLVTTYLLYRTLLLINRKLKFSPSTAGADILCIAVASIYVFAMIVVYGYGILTTPASFFLTVSAGLLLIVGCVLFLYRKNKLSTHENDIK